MAAFLPKDLVIFEILPKLPVKSLMRFKCVSKYWMTCISGDRLLIDAHRRRQQQSVLVLHDVRLEPEEIIARPGLYPEGCELPPQPQTITVCSEQFSKVKKIDLSYLIDGPIAVSSSCKGLLCVTYMDFPDRAVLWNPATRQRRQLSSPADSSRLWAVGIGMDEASGEWKVVRLCLESDDPSTEYPERASLVRAHVLAEGSTVWRDGGVSGIKGMFLYRGIDTLAVAGALHWGFYPTDRKEIYDGGILSFDLTEEVFRYTEAPKERYEMCNWKSSLAVITYKGRSSTISVASPSSCGNNVSWIKAVTFNVEVCWVCRDHCLLWAREGSYFAATLRWLDPEAPGEVTSLLQHIRAQKALFYVHDYVQTIASVF